jgi:hypothetical protein
MFEQTSKSLNESLSERKNLFSIGERIFEQLFGHLCLNERLNEGLYLNENLSK